MEKINFQLDDAECRLKSKLALVLTLFYGPRNVRFRFRNKSEGELNNQSYIWRMEEWSWFNALCVFVFACAFFSWRNPLLFAINFAICIMQHSLLSFSLKLIQWQWITLIWEEVRQCKKNVPCIPRGVNGCFQIDAISIIFIEILVSTFIGSDLHTNNNNNVNIDSASFYSKLMAVVSIIHHQNFTTRMRCICVRV